MSAYLDHAATTPLLAAPGTRWSAALGTWATRRRSTPTAGPRRRRIEESREAIADALGVWPHEVIFTSGGTEADNLAVKGLWWSRTAQDPARRRVSATRIEHHAVLDSVALAGRARGCRGRLAGGRRRPAGWTPSRSARELEAQPGRAALVAVMWANNEVGDGPADRGDRRRSAADHGVPLHVDAVQAVGSIPVDAAPATTAWPSPRTSSAGRWGSVRWSPGVGLGLAPLAHGGGQERKVRSGTFNVAGDRRVRRRGGARGRDAAGAVRRACGAARRAASRASRGRGSGRDRQRRARRGPDVRAAGQRPLSASPAARARRC